MQVPAEITFQSCEPSDEMRAEVAKQLNHLEQFSDRITSCHVVVIGPHTRHKHGDGFNVHIVIAMPEHKDVVVNREHGHVSAHEHPLVAIRDAFAAARRQLEEAVRDMRGQVKQHAVAEAEGRVTKFIAGGDYGFLETGDGREIYFHRNAVLHDSFDHLQVGADVRFVEEQGDKGAQASTVRLIGKHHLT